MSTVTTQLNSGSTPIAVSQGGTGDSTLTTAYAPVCGGTLSNPKFQPASSGISTSGSILVSTGSGSLPAYQTPPVKITSVTLATADIQGMYATPFQIIPSQGAHTLIVAYDIILQFVYNSSPFSGGGNVIIQYNNTAHAGGIVVCSGLINISTANSGVSYGNVVNQPGSYSGVTGNIVNQGLYITNQTGAFTGGNSSAIVTVYYTVLPTTV